MYPYPPSLLSYPRSMFLVFQPSNPGDRWRFRLIGRGGQVGELIGWSRGDAKSQGLKSPFVGTNFPMGIRVTKNFRYLKWRVSWSLFTAILRMGKLAYISRIHTAYIGEDTCILGTWNLWWLRVYLGGSSQLSKWLIAMVFRKSPKDRVVGSLPNGRTSWLIKGGY